MDWTWIANLFPVAVRLWPVIAKYGPAAVALYEADESTALQLFSDVAATVGDFEPYRVDQSDDQVGADTGKVRADRRRDGPAVHRGR